MEIECIGAWTYLPFEWGKGFVALMNPTKVGSEVLHKENTPKDEYYVYGFYRDKRLNTKDGYGLKCMKLINGVPTIKEDYHAPTNKELKSKYCLCRLHE